MMWLLWLGFKKAVGVFLCCSGLRTLHCHCCNLGHCCGLGLIPGPGTSTHHKCSQKKNLWSSCYGSVVTNPTSIHEDTGSSLDPTQWVKDLVLLWLWCRLAAAALIGPLAWELPYAIGVGPKRKTKQNKKTDNNRFLYEVKKLEP